MNSYLLLRDNKQTGPYSAEEIIAKGFKPYDLVWLEGKSAGWRYPGELPELAPHAPLTEEQPFDRFYKKPAAKTVEQEKKSPVAKPVYEERKLEEKPNQSTIATESPLLPFPQEKVVRSRKIFVTLPGNAVTATTASVPPPSAPSSITKKDTTVNEKPNMTALPSTPVTGKPTAIPVPFPPAKEKTPIENILPSPDKIKVVRQIPYGKMIRGAVAVCILLGGVVIGLAISTSGKTEEQKQLDALVQQIKEKRLGNNHQEPVPVPVTAVTTNKDSMVAELPESNNTLTAASSQNIAASQVIDKSTANQTINVVSHPVEKEKSSTGSSLPATAEKPSPVAKAEINPESIRKFISVKANDYKTGVLGGISKLQLTISNNSLQLLESVNVEVRYLGPEKKIVNTQVITISNIAAGQEKTQAIPSSKRGVTVDYSIVKITPALSGGSAPVL